MLPKKSRKSSESVDEENQALPRKKKTLIEDEEEEEEEDDSEDDDDDEDDDDELVEDDDVDDDEDVVAEEEEEDSEVDEEEEDEEGEEEAILSLPPPLEFIEQPELDLNEMDIDVNDETHLVKISNQITHQLMNKYHPELLQRTAEEIEALKDSHWTIPFLTKFERTRVIAERAEQLNRGATPYIDMTETPLLDSYLIAKLELEAKKLPFLIRRILPNGQSEYWRLSELL